MKISENWLRELVDPGRDREGLVGLLTSIGMPVESVTPVAEPFAGVVVGEVREAQAHPDASKLSVCKVFDGAAEHTVVCGAPNARAGLKSAFARVGAVLPDGRRIGTAKLRGVTSHGMLCSAAELGLGDEAGGIVELPTAFQAGADLREALGLDDVSIELELMPNRGDWLSVLGIAREVSLATGAEVRRQPCPPVPATIADRFPVVLDDPSACPIYLGRVIRGVDLSRESPVWLTERLRRAGLRPIHPVVDVTNYVMLELGQPLHAFDLSRLARGITVRRARAGEKLLMLDGSEIELDVSSLLITDADGPVALAGVMGGARSGMQADSGDVFLECAFFTPRGVAGTARRYGMHTDASQRFERGVDPELQRAAIERATALLLQIVGGKPGPVGEAVSPAHVPERRHVTLRRPRLEQLVGTTIPAHEVQLILTRVGDDTLQVVDEGDDTTYIVEAPSWRFDLLREVDLVEEICRIRGYDSIPARAPATHLELRQIPRDVTAPRRVKELLADLGYQEVITYSFVDPRHQDLLDPGARAVRLVNPMSQDQSVMRTNLLPGLLGALATNASRQQTRARLFELGRCFRSDGTLEQHWMLGGVLWGDRWPEGWGERRQNVDFFDAKGDVERVLMLVRQDTASCSWERFQHPVWHPGQAAEVHVAGSPAGRVGRLHPEIEQRLDLRGPVFVFELEAEALLRGAVPVHRPVSRFPSVRRDLSLRLPEEVPAGEVERVLRAALGSVMTEFRVFDVYRGEGVDSSEKSVAVGLTLQEPSRTLMDPDINGLMDAAVGALETELGARLR